MMEASAAALSLSMERSTGDPSPSGWRIPTSSSEASSSEPGSESEGEGAEGEEQEAVVRLSDLEVAIRRPRLYSARL